MKRRVLVQSGVVLFAGMVLNACARLFRGTSSSRVSYRGAFDPNAYNRLPEVVDAHHRFQAHPDRASILERGLGIIERRGHSPALGLFLLHRHFPTPATTIMLEYADRRPTGEWVYITAPTVPSKSTPLYAPSRFMFVKRNGATSLIPIEFSTDAAVMSSWQEVVTDQNLLEEMHSLLEDAGVENMLGLAIVPREHEGANQVLLEDTIIEPPHSLVRWVFPTEFDPDLAIPTVFSSRRADGCCTIIITCVFCFNGPGTDHGCTGEHIGCV